jgi:hypothetical protein
MIARARRPPVRTLCLLLVGIACSGGGGTAGAARHKELAPFFGEYAVTIKGSVGGPYEPSGSIVSGTTTGIWPFTTAGTVTLKAPRVGVMAVPPGMTIPGVKPSDIIFGAALMRNPIDVYVGTPSASVAGDQRIHTTLTFGIPAAGGVNNDLNFSGSGCVAGLNPGASWDCIPLFYEPRVMSGETVDLTYLVNRVTGDATQIRVTGLLVDRHAAEATVANLFMVPISTPIGGDFADIFYFQDGMSFELTVAGNAIRGSISGSGRSVAGLVPQTAILEATLTGTRR